MLWQTHSVWGIDRSPCRLSCVLGKPSGFHGDAGSPGQLLASSVVRSALAQSPVTRGAWRRLSVFSSAVPAASLVALSAGHCPLTWSRGPQHGPEHVLYEMDRERLGQGRAHS